MKAVILAGGVGTRLSEETGVRPKPMVEIGGKPILWHIMKIYSAYGINEFIICLGYKGYFIKEYFSKYFLHMSDITFDLKNNSMEVHNNGVEPWKVTLIDTGETTMTGGRLKRVGDYIGDETFCFTYGDGVSDINIRELIEFHKSQNTMATITAVQPPGRFGVINIKEDQNIILSFKEKPKGDGAWVNGGFFVIEPEVLDYISDDMSVWEQEPMQNLSNNRMLSAYKHYGFWQPMDTLRDKSYLEDLWNSGNAPWKVW
jgi:glucose-1-phosphate cytidylyltransferase